MRRREKRGASPTPRVPRPPRRHTKRLTASSPTGSSRSLRAASSARPELAISRLAEARDDVALLVEALVERGFDHADPRAQHRHQADRLREPRALRHRERRLHLRILDGKVRRGLVKKERRELADERAELLWLRPLVAQTRDLLADQRMRRDVQLLGQALTRSGVMPGTGKRRVRSRTSAAMSCAAVSSPLVLSARAMSAPMRSISASRIPRVVTAGVPSRMPDAIAGFSGS